MLPAQPGTHSPHKQASIGCRADITVDGERTLRVFNIYCPPTKDLALDAMETTNVDCLVVGDFNSHSDRWGYSETDAPGSEVEDWEIYVNFQLLNSANDTPTFYSRTWKTTSTPDPTFSTGDLAHQITQSSRTASW
jgi:hypothetical protein